MVSPRSGQKLDDQLDIGAMSILNIFISSVVDNSILERTVSSWTDLIKIRLTGDNLGCTKSMALITDREGATG
jgi:hypothetical protein